MSVWPYYVPLITYVIRFVGFQALCSLTKVVCLAQAGSVSHACGNLPACYPIHCTRVYDSSNTSGVRFQDCIPRPVRDHRRGELLQTNIEIL